MRTQARAGERIVLSRGPLTSTWVLESPQFLHDDRRQRRRSSAITALVLAPVVVSLTLVVISFFALAMYEVDGASMSPVLSDGSHVVVNKLAYRSPYAGLPDWLPVTDHPVRGDLIVFRSSRVPHGISVKRVIGLPGETIQIRPDTGQIVVNALPLDEPYARWQTRCSNDCRWTVPPAGYFVLGDNRSVSLDSRRGWFVSEDEIIGKVLVEY